MLAYLHGNVLLHKPPYLVLDVHQVGYKIFVPIPILAQYQPGSALKLYTYQYLRENSIELYGFAELADLELFEQLITVSGIGPKAGLALLSQHTATALKQAIATNDIAVLTTTSGIGKKTAQRLVLELKGKFATLINPTATPLTDAIGALENLGYSTAEASAALAQIDRTLSLEQQIKAALKLLGQARRKLN
ncbi:MAG: Holliday junction branch migration protein RuvA [Patescibacteria group bacterium]|jgi:Holliday junction DNA helicase RuvA